MSTFKAPPRCLIKSNLFFKFLAKYEVHHTLNTQRISTIMPPMKAHVNVIFALRCNVLPPFCASSQMPMQDRVPHKAET